jgi:hypothetical protein
MGFQGFSIAPPLIPLTKELIRSISADAGTGEAELLPC